jgi:hypothetical protein
MSALYVDMPAKEKPNTSRMPVGTYALHMSGEKRNLWGVLKATGELTLLAEYKPEDELSIITGGEMNLVGDWLYAEEMEIRVQEANKKETEERNSKQNKIEDWRDTGRLAVRYSDGKIISGNVQADVMMEAVNYLIEEHNLMENINVPYIPGYKNALISTQPKHPNGEEMSRPRELSNGYYLEATMGREQKKNHVKNLCEQIPEVDADFEGWGDDD